MSVHETGESPGAAGTEVDQRVFPVRLNGGYYNGARLLGLEGETAVYYNRGSRSLVRYRYDADERLLHAEHGADEPLPEGTSIGTYLRTHRDGFTVLSAWGEVLVADDGSE